MHRADVEGLCKLLAVGLPSVGIFSAEGGQFVGGHGMADDAKLRTASGLSALWDGEPIKRIRAMDGCTVLPGRRVAMHLMVQPDVAVIWFGDRLPHRARLHVARFGDGTRGGERNSHVERAIGQKRCGHEALQCAPSRNPEAAIAARSKEPAMNWHRVRCRSPEARAPLDRLAR